MSRNAYIEINPSNLTSNVQALIGQYPVYEHYIGVVKGNAYGHTLKSVKHLIDGGINYLAVSFLDQAIAIRLDGIDTPILLLQPIHLEDVESAVKNNITITVSNYEYFQKLITLPVTQELKIHLKINSGFNRLGISNKEHVEKIVNTIKQTKNFKLEGIYSHLATSGRRDNHFDTQIERFKDLTSQINLKEIPIVHMGRSLTLFTQNKIDFCNSVRIGIAMFGYGVSQPAQTGIKGFIKKVLGISAKEKIINGPVLKPAFGLYSEIIEINHVREGEYIGYGATYRAGKNCIIGCIPVGYADGFFRSNKNGYVAIGGKQYQIIAVDMEITTVLVDESVKVYDKVELIGETITAKEVATRCGTTIYEIMCECNESLPRIFKK
ncbi:MAG: alanine racemase [bacterium]